MTLGIDVSWHGRTRHLSWWNTMPPAPAALRPAGRGPAGRAITVVAPVAAAGAAPGGASRRGRLWFHVRCPALSATRGLGALTRGSGSGGSFPWSWTPGGRLPRRGVDQRALGGALQQLRGVPAAHGAGDGDLRGQRVDGLLEQVALGEGGRGAAGVAHDRSDDLDAVGETADWSCGDLAAGDLMRWAQDAFFAGGFADGLAELGDQRKSISSSSFFLSIRRRPTTSLPSAGTEICISSPMTSRSTYFRAARP